MAENLDDDLRAAVALVRAALRGDQEGVDAIIGTSDPYDLLVAIAGLAAATLVDVTGSAERADVVLAAWQEQRRTEG